MWKDLVVLIGCVLIWQMALAQEPMSPEKTGRPSVAERMAKQQAHLETRLAAITDAQAALAANPAIREVLERATQITKELEHDRQGIERRLKKVRAAMDVIRAQPAMLDTLADAGAF